MGPAVGALEFDGAAGSPGAFGDSKRSLVIVGGIYHHNVDYGNFKIIS